MNTSINNIIGQANETFTKELERITYNRERSIYFAKRLEEKYESIVEACKAWGIEVTGIKMHKTGQHGSDWSSENFVKLTIENEPINNKIRFMKKRPYEYTKSGEGVNRKKLNEKSRKITDAMKEVTGLSVNMNPLSLESEDGKPRSILLDMWIKE